MIWSIISYYYLLLSPVIFILVVLILGFVTPGYNHISHTISRLAIEKYSFIQTINFLHFGIYILILGYKFSNISINAKLKKYWKTISIICLLSVLLVIIFPSDPIEDKAFSNDLITLHGIFHFLTIIIFFILSPLGIRKLTRLMKKDPIFRIHALFTQITGFTVFTLCIFWIIFYTSNLYMLQRGLFQKIIVLICILWLEKIISSAKKYLLEKKLRSV